MTHKPLVSRRLIHRSKRRASAIAEAAFVLPVIILIAFGALETCSAIFTLQSVSVASYEGARVATQPFATVDQVNDHTGFILSVRRVNDFEISITANGVVVDDLEDVEPGTPIKVAVSAPANSNAILLVPLFGGRTLEHSVTMIKE
jgi:hypothetical protein